MTSPILDGLPDSLPASPLELLGDWLDENKQRTSAPDPWAMTLATIDPDGRPSARIVLCRGYDRENGVVAFYTNRESRKGRALAANPYAAVVFHWADLERQIRVEGPVTESPEWESDRYFSRRHRKSQEAAWASRQSRPLDSRATFLQALDDMAKRFEGEETIPRPPHWGGYRITAERIELWTQREARTHDRAIWTRSGDGWEVTRQYP